MATHTIGHLTDKHTHFKETANIFFQLIGLSFSFVELNSLNLLRAPNTNVTPTAGFSIIAQNDARHTQYSWTKNVTLFLYSFIGSTSVSLLQNQVIEVNGVRYELDVNLCQLFTPILRISNLPYEANGVKISRTKHNLQLDSYVGVG